MPRKARAAKRNPELKPAKKNAAASTASSSGETSGGSQPAENKVVEVYRLENGVYATYTLVAGGGGVLKRNGYPVATSKITGFDRVVFFHQVDKGRPLLVIDLVPPTNVNNPIDGATFDWNRTAGKVTVSSRIRCFLHPDDNVRLEVEITGIRSSATRYEKLAIAGQGISGLVKPNIESSLESKKIRVPTGCSTLFHASNLEEKIDFKTVPSPGPGPCQRHLVISFVRPISSSQIRPFHLKFDANFEFTNEQSVRAFSVNVKGRDRQWAISQYPLTTLKDQPKVVEKAGVAASQWIIQIKGFPAGDMVDQWNSYLPQYYDSLKTVQGGLPVSFVPKLRIEGTHAKKKWGLSYLLTDPLADEMLSTSDFEISDLDRVVLLKNKVTIMALRLQPVEPQNLTITLPLLKKHDATALSGGELFIELPRTEAEIRPLFEKDGSTERGLNIFFNNAPGAALEAVRPMTSVRMGALDLEFSTDSTQKSWNESYFRIRPHKIDGSTLLEVHVDADFAVSEIKPGGQDNILGENFVPEGSTASALERCTVDPFTPDELVLIGKDGKAPESNIEAHFRRSRPIVIDPQARAGATAKKPVGYLLRADEDAQPGSSHTLVLKLRTIPRVAGLARASSKETAIVLDSSPFLVAQVNYPRFSTAEAGITEIGNWTNAGLEGPGWQLKSLSQPFDLVLPPQVLGEEMEKAKNVDENQAIDFRFSPPATIELKGSDNPQNFTEPPWNLRRILGYPGQRNQGQSIKSLQFELLYGLSCDSEHPFLRLAEIASMIGAMQGRLVPGPKSTLLTDEQKKLYQQIRAEWAIIYHRYLSRIAILEPWDSHQPESLLISQDTRCWIRADDDLNNPNGSGLPRADMARPFPDPTPPPGVTPTQTPTPTPSVTPTPPLLEGGAIWGFESNNVYNAVMRKNGKPNPESDGAEISEPYFSSLGGWGHVKAPFDKKRSTIYGDAAMGRTYQYKLERIGRIGVFWNLAKHVIVYERSVVPSRQMYQFQNQHFGRPIIRKTQEYVEILEEKREYPDFGDPQSESLKQQRGFVAACSFPKGARYNVLSSWGADVGDMGWKVPIWNPAATPKDVYPKPQGHLHLMSDVAGKSEPVPCPIACPENIFFYTDTRATTDGNPHNWDPIKDVDFVDCPKPVPCEDFKDGKNVQTTPDDPPVPVGFSPCTFRLEPAAVPTNVVAERTAKPLSAVLETVTMMRASIKVAGETVGQAPHEQLIDLRNKAAGVFQKILSQIPADATLVEKQFDAIKANVLASLTPPLLKDIEDSIKVIETKANTEIAAFKDKIKKYEGDLFLKLEKSLTEAILGQEKSLIQQVTQRYDDLLRPLTDWPANRDKYFNEAARSLEQLQEKLLLLDVSPGLLQQTIRRYANAYSQWATDLLEVVNRINRFLSTAPNSISGPQLKSFQALIRDMDRVITTFESQISSGLFRPGMVWMLDPHAKLAETHLAGLKAGFDDAVKALHFALDQQTSLAITDARKITAFVDATWQASRDQLDTFIKTELAGVENEFNGLARDWIDKQSGDLKTLREKASASLTEFHDLVRKFKTRIDKSAPDAENLFRKIEAIRAKVLAEIDPTKALFKLATGSLTKEINDLANSVGLAAFTQRIEKVFQDFASEKQKIREELDKSLKGFVSDVGDFAEKNVRALIPDLPDGKYVYAKADSVARVISAFGKPPQVPNLAFERPEIAYFYDVADKHVGLTPVISRVAQVSAIANELQALGVALPTNQVLERLIPPSLQNFNFSDILPKFAGMDLSNLFSGLKMPEMGTENIKVSHGVDQQSRRAWVQSDVNVGIQEPATVFTIGPVKLRLTSADFVAKMRFEAGLNEPPKRIVQGSIKGTWEFVVSEIPIVKFNKAELKFDDSGNFRFKLSPMDVELPGAMAFVSDFLKSFSNPDSGFSLGITPKGVRALLNLPIPDIQGATSGISGLTLGMAFGLDFENDFKITLSFLLARKEAPFALTIFILGGGGYIELESSYTPSTQSIGCRVHIGITASASLAIALGPIKGGVYVYFGITADLDLQSKGGGKGLTIGIMLLIRGVVDILGIVSAEVALLLEVNYNNGQLVGRGTISIKIKICWCFTLNVRKSVQYTIGSGGGNSQNRSLPSFDQTTATNGNGRKYLSGPNAGAESDSEFALMPAPDYPKLARHYIEMLS